LRLAAPIFLVKIRRAKHGIQEYYKGDENNVLLFPTRWMANKNRRPSQPTMPFLWRLAKRQCCLQHVSF